MFQVSKVSGIKLSPFLIHDYSRSLPIKTYQNEQFNDEDKWVRRRAVIPHVAHVPEYEAEWRRLHPTIPEDVTWMATDTYPKWHAEEGARRMAQVTKEEERAIRAVRTSGRLEKLDKKTVREALKALARRRGQRVVD